MTDDWRIQKLDRITCLCWATALAGLDAELVGELGTAYSDERWGPAHFLANRASKWVLSRLALEACGRELAGFCVASQVASNVHVHRLAVRSCHRGQGLGRALVEAVCKQGQELRLDCVTLMVSGSNMDAIAFYERLGFKRAEGEVLRKVAERHGQMLRSAHDQPTIGGTIPQVYIRPLI